MSILTIIGDIFNHSPILISLSAALMLGAEVWGLKKRYDLKKLEQTSGSGSGNH